MCDQISTNIDLNNKKHKLNESFLMMFGAAVQLLMKSIFGGGSFAGKIKGTPHQIDSFAKVLAGEKRYMDSFYKFGLNNPNTYRTKNILDKSIVNFENATGIKWPFDN